MSELEKAQQEVEQVCFAYDKAGITGDIKDWKEYYELENSLIKKVKLANQLQLTIPKSVADLLDERWKAQNRYLQRKVTVARDALYNAVNPYDNELAGTSMGEWIDENQNICFVYLAGKALGVNLVKVVDE